VLQFKPEQCTLTSEAFCPPELRFDILEESKSASRFPIVLHGSSSVLPQYVKLITQYGGKMDAAVGIPDELLRRRRKVCRVKITSPPTAPCVSA
jgi:fructose-bisphosphate aldolase class II